MWFFAVRTQAAVFVFSVGPDVYTIVVGQTLLHGILETLLNRISETLLNKISETLLNRISETLLN